MARHIGRHIHRGSDCRLWRIRNRQDLFRGWLARGMESADIVSPTYVFFHVYPGKIPLAHIDAYRLEGLSEEEIALTGIEDCFAAGNVALSSGRVLSTLGCRRARWSCIWNVVLLRY